MQILSFCVFWLPRVRIGSRNVVEENGGVNRAVLPRHIMRRSKK
jgi:hypothetical protein